MTLEQPDRASIVLEAGPRTSHLAAVVVVAVELAALALLVTALAVLWLR
jgi:hypothetical protein